MFLDPCRSGFSTLDLFDPMFEWNTYCRALILLRTCVVWVSLVWLRSSTFSSLRSCSPLPEMSTPSHARRTRQDINKKWLFFIYFFYSLPFFTMKICFHRANVKVKTQDTNYLSPLVKFLKIILCLNVHKSQHTFLTIIVIYHIPYHTNKHGTPV